MFSNKTTSLTKLIRTKQFLGLPLDKVRSRVDRAKVLEARQNMINSELNEMENII